MEDLRLLKTTIAARKKRLSFKKYVLLLPRKGSAWDYKYIGITNKVFFHICLVEILKMLGKYMGTYTWWINFKVKLPAENLQL